jgi:hypothetical protein
MAKVVTGRYTAQADGSLVVFLIGMRINRLWAVRKWVPTFLAMVRMLPLLFRHPEKGFLGAQTIFYWRGSGWCSTGAPSTISSASPAARPSRTWPPGGGSIGLSATGTAASGSGTSHI